MPKEILRLTKFWYKYINLNHHKDRDCYFYITEIWGYGEMPKYRVEHYGYIYNEKIIMCNTYKQAQKELTKLLKSIIKKEKKWAEEVLKEPNEWDKQQVEQAKYVMKFKV